MSISYAENKKKQESRDAKLLWYLSSGIATKEQINKDIFVDNDGNILNRQNCERRLSKKLKVGEIVKQQYESSNKLITVYSLTEAGRDRVSELYNIERDHIRSGFPRKEVLVHDHVLSNIFRKLRSEASESRYRIDYLYDDKVMKFVIKPRKGIFYPDGFLRIVRAKKGSIDICLEYDNGSKGRYWVHKINSWNHVTLILTSNQNRVSRLKEYIWESKRQVPTAFSCVDDFLTNGLAATQWDWLPSKQKGIFDLS
jgi:hypothetical protein